MAVRKNLPDGSPSRSITCPACSTVSDLGLYLFPLQFDDLESAIVLRKEWMLQALSKTRKKRPREDTNISLEEDKIINLGTAYAVYSLGNASPNPIAGAAAKEIPDISRTGRWNDAEVAFTDHLVASFDKGFLPIPNGTKLNQFLGDILFCKASRLTKKMKNAKLTRVYRRSFHAKSKDQYNDPIKLATLEKGFLGSLGSEYVRREVRFNLTKQWRSHLSNMFLQLGSPALDVHDWVSSLEELERRSNQAESELRKNYRRSNARLATIDEMSETANSKKFRRDPAMTSAPLPMLSSSLEMNEEFKDSLGLDIFDEECNDQSSLKHSGTNDENTSIGPDAFDSLMKSSGNHQATFPQDPVLVEESSLDSVLGESSSTGDSNKPSIPPRKNSKNFMNAIVSYISQQKIPFQHADCWVPSAPTGTSQTGGTSDGVRLLHAGCVTKPGLPQPLQEAMSSFGEYSSSFSFSPGCGIPGRIFAHGEPQWENDLRALNTVSFQRMKGAITHGIKTVAGFSLPCVGVGRMVIVLYSQYQVPKDLSMLTTMVEVLGPRRPQPKWKLVIEVTAPEVTSCPSATEAASELGKKDNSTHLDNEIAAAFEDIEFDDLANSNFMLTPNTPNPELSQPAAFSAGLSKDEMGSLSLPDAQPNSEPNKQDETVTKMLSLLGSQTSSSEFGTQMQLLANFLLKSSSNRRLLPSEVELLETLKCSYRSYNRSQNKRGRTELCKLLIQDWICLKSTMDRDTCVPSNGINLSSQSSLDHTTQQYQSDGMAPMGGRLPTPGLAKPPPMAHSAHLLGMSRTQSLPKMSIQPSCLAPNQGGGPGRVGIDTTHSTGISGTSAAIAGETPAVPSQPPQLRRRYSYADPISIHQSRTSIIAPMVLPTSSVSSAPVHQQLQRPTLYHQPRKLHAAPAPTSAMM